MLLFQLLTGTQEALMNRARAFYSFVLAKLIALGLILVFAGYICNIAGARGINLFFSLVTTITAIMIAIRPEIVVSMVELAVLYGTVTGTTIPDDIQKFARWYIKIVNKVLMWLSLVFFSLGTIPFKENPKAFFGIVSGLVLLGLLSSVWGLGGKLGKNLIYWYVSLIVALFFASLIPGSYWKTFFSYNPKENVETLNKEETIAHIEEKQKRNEIRKDLKRLEEIENSVDKEEELSAKDKEFLKKAQKERDENSIPGKIGGGISKIKEAIPQPSSSTLPPIRVEPQKSYWMLCREPGHKDCDKVELQVFGSGEAVNIMRWEPGGFNVMREVFRADRTSGNSYAGSWSQRTPLLFEPLSPDGRCAIEFNSAWESAEIKITASGETVTLQMKK